MGGGSSDTIGSRTVIRWALGFYVLASAALGWITSVEMFLVLRALQGLVVGAVVVAASIAKVRALYTGDDCARVLSFVYFFLGCAILMGPPLGSLMLLFFGWRSLFWAMTLAGAMMFYISHSFSEERLTEVEGSDTDGTCMLKNDRPGWLRALGFGGLWLRYSSVASF